MAKRKNISLKLADLNPDPDNPREITPDALKALGVSLEEYGDLSGITWNKKTKQLVCGHQRLKALLEKYGDALEMEDNAIKTPASEVFRIRIVDWPYERQRMANIVANSPLIAGTWTDSVLDQLEDLRHELPELSEQLRLDDLSDQLQEAFQNADVAPSGGQTDPDDVPVEVEPVAKRGQLWQLRAHRLLCGDCTKAEDHDRVLDGESVDLVLTDPPYGVGIEYGVGIDVSQKFDDSHEAVIKLIPKFMPLVLRWPAVLIASGHRMMWDCPRPKWLLAWFIPAGGGNNPWGFTTLHPILAYGKDPYLARGLGGRPDGISMMATRDPEVRGHPVCKPIKVWSWLMERGSVDHGDCIFDPFLGSGTTIIAAEQLNRRCYAIEIEPKYVDVAIKRWEQFTGKKAELVNG